MGNIAGVPYHCPGSPELAEAVIRATRGHNVVLLSDHGQVAHGKDFDEVPGQTLFLEMACQIIVPGGEDHTVLVEEKVEELSWRYQ